MVGSSSKLDPKAFAAKGLPLDYVTEVIPRLEAAGIEHYRQLVALSSNSITLAQVAGKLRMKPNNLMVLCKAADQILVDAVVNNPAFREVKSVKETGVAPRVETRTEPVLEQVAVREMVAVGAGGGSSLPPRPVPEAVLPTPSMQPVADVNGNGRKLPSAVDANDWRLLEVPRSTAEQLRDLAEVLKQRKPNSTKPVTLTPVRANGGLHFAHLLGPIRDQRQQPSGAVFALTAVHELFVRSLGKEQALSERHLWESVLSLGQPHTTLAAAALALSQTGQCRAQTWPYDSGDKVPLNARSEGSNFRPLVVPIERPTAAAVIRELETARLLAVRLPLSLVWVSNSMQGQTQLMEMIAASAGHAMAAVGFGDEGGQRVLYLRNSWGPRWGADHLLGAGHVTVQAEMFDKVVTEAYRIA